MAIEDRTRHERLRALLPQAYATDPRDSVLGVLLDALADGLRGLDQATERALRDKWIATAEASRAPADPTAPMLTIELGGAPKPLEHLGAALDLLRQPWEVDEQAYRGRVAMLAPLLSHGVGTTGALLMFTITALGAEPCPRLDRKGNTTTAIGLVPGRHARCRACRAGTGGTADVCPLLDESIMSASLIDNPRGRVTLSREALHPDEDGGAAIHFESNSLFADRPELELRIPVGEGDRFDDQYFDSASFLEDDARVVPSFRSRRTGERIVVAHALHSGDVLTVLPLSPYEPGVAPHLQQWVDRPSGSSPLSAVVRVNGEDLDVPVIAFSGTSFDGARFGGDRFAPEVGAPHFDQGTFDEASFDMVAAPGTLEISTPAVLPGSNTWDYVPLGDEELAAALASMPAEVSLPPPPVVGSADLRPVSLRLGWWTRPAARFLIRIPLTDAVRQAIAQGAGDYVRMMVERVRPMGVTAVIDFLEPPFRDEIEPSDLLRGLVLGITEPLSPFDATKFGPGLPAEVLDGLDALSFGGLFDVTPFDLSGFGIELVELREDLTPQARFGVEGLFDVVPFDIGVLAE